MHFELSFLYTIRWEFEFIYFACRNLVVSVPCVEKTVLSPVELSWHPYHKSVGYKCEVISRPSVLFHWSVMSVSMPGTTLS